MTAILFTGGRAYADYATVHHVMFALHDEFGLYMVVQGGATGADALARQYAKDYRHPLWTFEANWYDLVTQPVVLRQRSDGSEYNAAAGGIRNRRMLKEAQPALVVAFPGGPGTADMVKIAERAKVPVRKIPADILRPSIAP